MTGKHFNQQLINSRATGIWALLMLATGLSWWLGLEDHASADQVWASSALLVLAFVKVRYVILDFMEVRHAPLALRLSCEIWLVAVCASLLYLAAE